MTSSSENMIHASDFQSMELIITIKNEATKTILNHDPAKPIDPKKNPLIQVVEFLEKGFILEIPEKTCAAGHHLTIEISTRNANPALESNFTAKVLELEPLPGKRNQITVEFLSFHEKDWAAFQNLYGNRQTQIEEFFKAVKGHD